MYKLINVHIYKCLNQKYTHGQLYNVQTYNVQIFVNLQMYKVQIYNLKFVTTNVLRTIYNVQMDECTHLQMFESKIFTRSTV